MKFVTPLLLAALSLLFASCTPRKETQAYDLIPYSVVRIFPHDRDAFTEGLLVEQGRLFESTGGEKSWIAEVDIASGRQDKKVMLEKKYFGEGIAIVHNKVYQLTYQSHVGFIYALRTFKKTGEFKYDHEGWGMTFDGTHLILSDGTEKLRFLDTLSLKEISLLKVQDSDGAVNNLNELEFIDGFIFANQWQTNYILKIDPSTGNVVGRVDLSPIADRVSSVDQQADVLNGIAYEKKSGMLLVTGKHWPSLYAIRLEKKDAPK